MKLKTNIIFGIATLLFAVGLELILALPTHPECGTAGIDFMPCTYSARLWWYVQMGSWMPLAGLWLVANGSFWLCRHEKTKAVR